MDTEILQNLGLTNAEIKVYLTLLELGSSSAGPIIEKSGLQTSVIHRALNSLIEKGLINFVLEGKRKMYQATDPESFFDFINEKKRKFEEILPELKKKQSSSLQKEKATIYKGIRGVKEAYSIMINEKGKEYITFGGGPITTEIMGFTWWLNLHERRIANKLPSRQVFDVLVKEIDKGRIANKKITNIKYLSKEFAGFQETVIVGNLVSINVFTETPYSFVIKDKNVAESYKKYFELLWKQAKH
jgi:sugar-specific transcriptional regulator TrmB